MRSAARQLFSSRRFLFASGMVVALCCVLFMCIFGFYYAKYHRIVDERLKKPLFDNTAKIYAAPTQLRLGQKYTARFIAQQLRDAGYSIEGYSKTSPLGTYAAGADSITIHPGPQSFHAPDSATITFENGAIGQITGENGRLLEAYELEPLLVTDLSDQSRAKRRLVTYDELPKTLVQAVTSIEDHRFLKHGGVDYYSMLAWTWHDLRGDRRFAGGASTLTMQLAKMLFLSPERTFERKFLQIVITFQLEHRFSKQKIFELYANQVPLGQRGSFSINGFGEAAQAYFGRDVQQLSLPECALLAGIIQSPSRLNPYRHMQRALLRRNVVLDAMVETGSITREQGQEAKATPIKLAPGAVDTGEAPYFVDLVQDQLTSRLGDNDYNHDGLRIYTSLDPDLQRAASESITQGMKVVDEQVEKLHARRVKQGETTPVNYPQVALVALNPHTGQVLALVGGRNYEASQFDHAVQHRPTGSIFKPFVYAAAFNTSLGGTVLTQPPSQAPPHQEFVSADPAHPDSGRQTGIFTAITMLNNNLTTFEGGYSPANYHNDTRFTGDITARTALQWSENNATVSLAQMVGYDDVAALARDAGIKSARGTPSVALGSYDATPLDMTGAYTTFANGGVKIDPWFVASIRSANGDVLDEYPPNSKPILDSRVAYLTLALMENVINSGTGGTVRAHGFTAPAAGKTGTSRDAWFAGFTSNLLCVVWIGNDDYSDLKLEGGKTAAIVWTEFMKQAVRLPQYSDTKDFLPPTGVVQVKLDKATNLLADASCPDDYTASFLDGTQPKDTCDHSIGDQQNLFQQIFGTGKKPINPALVPNTSTTPPETQRTSSAQQPAVTAGAQNPPSQPETASKKKRGFFRRLFGGDKKDEQQQQSQQQPQ